MSRTIRRKNATWDHNYIHFRDLSIEAEHKWARANAGWMRCSESQDIAQVAIAKRFHSDKHRPMKNPNWWVHLHVHAPARVQERINNRRVLHLIDLEDAPLYPDRQHHNLPYFW